MYFHPYIHKKKQEGGLEIEEDNNPHPHNRNLGICTHTHNVIGVNLQHYRAPSNKQVNIPQLKDSIDTLGAIKSIDPNTNTTLGTLAVPPWQDGEVDLPEEYIHMILICLYLAHEVEIDPGCSQAILESVYSFPSTDDIEIPVALAVLYDGPDENFFYIKVCTEKGIFENKTNISEPNTGDPNTLASFITQAKSEIINVVHSFYSDEIVNAIYFDHSILVLSGHGDIFYGCMLDGSEDLLTPKEIRYALENSMGFEIVVLQSCFQGFFEMCYELKDLVRYFVGCPAFVPMNSITSNYGRNLLNYTLLETWFYGEITTEEFIARQRPIYMPQLRNLVFNPYYSISLCADLWSDSNNNGIKDLDEISNYLDELAQYYVENWDTEKQTIYDNYTAPIRIVSHTERYPEVRKDYMWYGIIPKIFSTFYSYINDTVERVKNLTRAIVIDDYGYPFPINLGVFLPLIEVTDPCGTYYLYPNETDVYAENGAYYMTFCEDTYWDEFIDKVREVLHEICDDSGGGGGGGTYDSPNPPDIPDDPDVPSLAIITMRTMNSVRCQKASLIDKNKNVDRICILSVEWIVGRNEGKYY